MRVLIDTCIVIDAMQNREPFAENARQLFRKAANKHFVGCLTAKSLTDIYYLMHRFTHDNKKSRETLSKLFVLFDAVDTAAMDCRRALGSDFSDYEDAVMCETAQRIDADCIVTRNVADYAHSPVAVMTPEQLLSALDEAQTEA